MHHVSALYAQLLIYTVTVVTDFLNERCALLLLNTIEYYHTLLATPYVFVIDSFVLLRIKDLL